jgi:glycosyltransferase involved in cell wall biosynthesis
VLRVAVWSPLPPSPSGIADYVAEQLPILARTLQVVSVAEDPGEARPDVDLDLYHLGNSPAHAYVYRAALARPGVAVLHDWSLHHLVLAETVERGDVSSYLREMRRAHGETGTFVGRQVARALGGDLLPSLFPLNDRVLEASLAVVGLTRYVAGRAALRLPGRPVLHLPHHLSLPLDPLPSRAEARRALGLPLDALLVTAPGLATQSKRIDAAVAAVARLLPSHPSLRLVVAGGVDPRLPLADWARDAGLGAALVVTGRLDLADFVRHLVAADVVLALRFPTHGEVSGALVRALGVGRPVLVTAGTPPSEEFPEGVVVPVDPGARELDELTAFLDRLLRDAALREAVGRVAREHVRTHHGLGATSDRLAVFLGEVHARRAELLESLVARRAPEGSLLSYLLDEVRWAALDLGLSGVPVGFEPLLDDLVPERP